MLHPLQNHCPHRITVGSDHTTSRGKLRLVSVFHNTNEMDNLQNRLAKRQPHTPLPHFAHSRAKSTPLMSLLPPLPPIVASLLIATQGNRISRILKAGSGTPTRTRWSQCCPQGPVRRPTINAFVLPHVQSCPSSGSGTRTTEDTIIRL